jgi:fructose-1,6-bisphosphatase I
MNNSVPQIAGKITTIERHILEEQRFHPEATGVLTYLLYDLALAGKIIASQTTKAGLVEILGETNQVNVQGEDQMKLDVMADHTIFRLNDHTGRLAVMASEEHEHILPIPKEFPLGKYVLLYDPLDGSSNIDYNVSIGTIFSVFRRVTEDGPGTLVDCLQPGRRMVAAGYLVYGSSTMLVYSTGRGVHGFTLDPAVGEFFLSHPNIRIPEKPKYYSVNHGSYSYWSEGMRRYVLAGGIFCYPADTKDPSKPEGKLRLLYEAAPLSFIAEQAGGTSSDGRRNILDIQPSELHQRTPLFVGDKKLVRAAEEFLQKFG